MSRGMVAGMTDYSHQSLDDIVADLKEWTGYLKETMVNIKSAVTELKASGYWEKVDYDFKNSTNYCIKFFESSDKELAEIANELSIEVRSDHISRIHHLFSTACEIENEFIKVWHQKDDNWKEYGDPQFRTVEIIYEEGRSMVVDMRDLSNLNSRLKTYVGRVMKTEARTAKMGTEKVLVFTFGTVFIITMLVLAVAFPNPSAFQYNVFRIILAIAIAGIAAFIPGFINLKLGTCLKAGGALAVFAIVYFFNPAQLISTPQDDPKFHEFSDKSPLEKAIAQARKDGLNYSEPSSSLLLAKTVTGYQFSNTKSPILITTVSPFKPIKQKTIFKANSCWAIGLIVEENPEKGLAKIDIKRMSCIDDSGKAYEYGLDDNTNRRIGYISSKETIGHDWIIASKNKNEISIPSDKDVLINFETPVQNLKFMGDVNDTKAVLDKLQNR
ncbi:hypothetical protein [Geobacter anodireducens]